MRKAIFLDRDGVLIRTSVRDGTPHPPQSLEDVEILPGVRRAMEIFRALHFRLLMITNQPDVARGTQTRGQVERINAALAHALSLDGVYVCYHDNIDACACRKPLPGLLLEAAAEHEIDLSASYMVGDRGGDIAAGAAAGCRTFLVERPYSRCDSTQPDHKADDLLDVAMQLRDKTKKTAVQRNPRSMKPVYPEPCHDANRIASR
ncbi:MAG TPA: HAD-IIIA family hydrolase [Tepidisphaeraceae bacterium]|jgi:D-glycero-D-manno-heptose 1,7-bisphosphate phosphatase|nr:HAD-IIIA family hydrolase [Tepidisphaeraceae bacterium]